MIDYPTGQVALSESPAHRMQVSRAEILDKIRHSSLVIPSSDLHRTVTQAYAYVHCKENHKSGTDMSSLLVRFNGVARLYKCTAVLDSIVYGKLRKLASLSNVYSCIAMGCAVSN
jgi:hypothetical protein